MTESNEEREEIAVAYALEDGDGEVIRWFGDTITVKAAGPAFDVAIVNAVAGNEAPLHVHASSDEAIYVLEGEVTVYVGGDTFRIASGSFAFVPRGVAHTFAVETGSARLLTVSAPTGALLMFSEAEEAFGTRGMPARLRQVDIERLDPALRGSGLTIVAPHPRT